MAELDVHGRQGNPRVCGIVWRVNTPSTADAWIAALRQAHDQLADLVRGLDDDGLARPSACSDWDVAQVLGHLGSGSEIAAATLDAALAGRDGPGPDFNQPVWDRWNALDNQAKAAGFLDHAENLVAAYEALDAATRADVRVKLPFFPEPVDVATLARMRTSEVTHHGWDVRVAFDPTATLHPAAVDLMIDHSGDFLAYLGRADLFAGRPATIAVETADPARSYTLTIAEAVSLAPAPPGAGASAADAVSHLPAPPEGASAADATLRLPAESWLRLTYGRLPPEHTPADVSLAGEITLDDLRRVFPGV